MSTTWAGDEHALPTGTEVGSWWRAGVGWMFGPPGAGRAPNRVLLDPPDDGHIMLPQRVREKLQDAHPAAAVGMVLVGSVILVASVLIGGGLLMTHFGTHARLGHWDEHVNQWFAAHRSSTWNRITGDFTFLADTVGIAGVAAVVTVLLLLRRWGRLAWLLAAALAVELSVFLVTNYTVQRPRPRVAHVGSTPSTFSWPSGHVAAVVALYGGIAVLVMVATSRAVLRLTAWMVAAALTVCVALSRMYRGEHHLTDTVAGLCLGVAALCTAIVVIQVWSSRARPTSRAGSPRVLRNPASEPQ